MPRGDIASKIARDIVCDPPHCKYPPYETHWCERIRDAIRRAVKAERERCVDCVCGLKYNPKLSGHDSMILRVVAAINTPATKRPSRRK